MGQFTPIYALAGCAIAGGSLVVGTFIWQEVTGAETETPPPVGPSSSTVVVSETILIPGPKGERGERGEQGFTGFQGRQGEQGVPGKDGQDGQDGATIIGPQGVPGRDGQSITGLPGRDGAVGPQGEQGLPGEIGEIGEQGIPGLNGEVGPVGPQGVPGPVSSELLCPDGFEPGELTLNAPGGQVTMYVCLDA